MESLQSVKGRIKTINSTKHITQSMQTVSKVKMRKARAKMDANLPFLNEAKRLVRLSAGSLNGDRHPFLTGRGGNRAALLILGSDRALCGGFNSGIEKEAQKLLQSVDEYRIITVGAKVRDHCRRRFRDKIVQSFTSISENPLYEDAENIALTLLDWYRNGEVDRIYVVYTHFETMLVQYARAMELLPMDLDEILSDDFISLAGSSEDGTNILLNCEPGTLNLFGGAVSFYVKALVYGLILQSSLSEQCARASVMDAAIKNADDMIESLTRLYNQARQRQITEEITEIINGADAV